jgi:hypothetical protein
MGFFDVFRSRSKPPASPRHPGPAEKAELTDKAAAVKLPPEKVPARVAEARQLLEKKNPEAAVRAFEQVLAVAGDKGEILAEISNELGKHGLIDKLVELIAPRYVIERHGPTAGMNLLQAYLVLGDSSAAGLMLGQLNKLNQSDLKQRLSELESLLKDLIEAEKGGRMPGRGADQEPVRISLVSISKPIWFYGLEPLADKLLPPKKAQVVNVAFAQLALPDHPAIGQLIGQPEEELGRLTRAIPLWLSETLFFCPNYSSIAALGLLEDKQRGSHYALFPAEWTEDNLRQLIETNKAPLDYIVTGSIKRKEGDTEMNIRLWEVKKLRVRKHFTVTWTPSTMDAELARFHEMLRTFMEWIAYPAGQGLPYTPASVPSAWLDTLGASVSLFLAEKGVLPSNRIRTAIDDVEKASARAAAGHSASLAWITLRKRATFLGFKVPAQQPVLASHPLVTKALELQG